MKFTTPELTTDEKRLIQASEGPAAISPCRPARLYNLLRNIFVGSDRFSWGSRSIKTSAPEPNRTGGTTMQIILGAGWSCLPGGGLWMIDRFGACKQGLFRVLVGCEQSK